MTIALRGDIPALIGPTLRRIRKMRGLRLRHISQATGLSISHLSDVERGTCGLSIEALMRWIEALGARCTLEIELEEH